MMKNNQRYRSALFSAAAMRATSVALLLLGLTTLIESAHPGDSKAKGSQERSKTIEINASGSRQFLDYGIDQLKYHAEHEVNNPDANGIRSAHLTLFVSDRRDEARFKIWFAPVRENDLIPMFGAICRIGKVQSNERPAPPGAKISVIDNDLPLKVTIEDGNAMRTPSPSNALAIPSGGSLIRYEGENRSQWYSIRITSITYEFGLDSCHLQITNVRPDGVIGSQTTAKFDRQIVVTPGEHFSVPAVYRRGGKLFHPVESFRVREIVPADKKKQLVGWITLEPLRDGWGKE